MALIPHLDNTIRASLDRLNWQQDIVDQELRERLMLGMGHPDFFASPSYGIVAETEPASDLSGGSASLAVSASAPGSGTAVDVNPGMAVTKSGLWIRLNNIIRAVSLADPTPGTTNVIYLSYGLQSSPLQQNDWQEWVYPVSARYGDTPQLSGISGLLTAEDAYVKVDKVTTYLTYSANVSVHFIPLAIVTVQQIEDPITHVLTTTMAIDHTRDNYSWNRPWFSTVDSEHRAKLGTGVQSDQNTHALSQNEITAGKFTPFQLALNHGMIIAKDRSFEKIPGYWCEETFMVDQLESDDPDGTATGFPLAWWFKLPQYPVRLGKTWVMPSNQEVGALLVPGTNRIVFPGETLPAGETIHVYYTRVELCEPPQDNVVTFSTNNPAEGELLIAGGLAHETLASTEETLSDSYQFPMLYHLYVDAGGSMRRTPQVIYCLKRLELAGVQDTTSITQYAPGKIMIGLAGAAPGFTEVKIQIYGTNSAGAAINHLFTFTNATWTPFTVPSTTIPTGSVQISTEVFATVTNYVVVSRIGDGVNSAIMLWSIQTPYDSYDKMKDAALVADLTWDGLRIATIRDRRVIETTESVNLGADAGLELFEFAVNQFAGGRQTLYREDFRRPTLHLLDHPTNWYPALGTDTVSKDLPRSNLSKLQVGLNGAYRTRALPVLSGSGTLFRVTFLPLRLEHGTNEFVPLAPRFRYKLAAGWSMWHSMVTVMGMSSSFEWSVFGGVTPMAVQLELDPRAATGFVLYG